MTSILTAISDWVQGIIASAGYLGLVLVMVLENVFPPVPSEIVLPLAGYMTLQGHFTLLGVTAVGTLGSVIGALILYALGWWLDESRVRYLLNRYGRFAMLTEGDLNKSLCWFNRYGQPTIFFARLVPIVRSLISVPAGLARMPLMRFVLLTALGTGLWSFFLTWAGRTLGANWSRVAEVVSRYQDAVVVVAGVLVVGFFAQRARRRLGHGRGGP
jgi:membrane protein DedA with SNARE-associated domain